MDSTVTLFLYIIVAIFSLIFIKLAEVVNNFNRVSKGYCLYQYSTKSVITVRKSSCLLAISFLFLFLLSALRNYVGRDYPAYISLFRDIGLSNYTSAEWEWIIQSPLFVLICKIISYVTDSYLAMFAVIGFITLILFYRSIKIISTDWTFSLYLFLCFCLYFQSFNQIRQMAAVAAIVCSYQYLIEDNLKKFLIILAVAMSFHLTAGIFAFAWIFRKRDMNIKNILVYITMGILVFMFFDSIITRISFISYVQIYSLDENTSSSFGLYTILNFGVRILLFIFCLFFYKTTVSRSPNTKVLYNIAAICTILQVGAIMFNIFGRLTTYYYVAYIFLIPEVIKTIGNRFTLGSSFFVKGLAYGCFAIYFIIYYFSPSGAEGSGYMNYKSWLF